MAATANDPDSIVCTVAVNKKLMIHCRRNDHATMRIVLKKRSQHEELHAVYTVCARVRGQWVTLCVGYKGGNHLTGGEKRCV